MKKKFFTLIIAICLMIPIGIGLVACGKEHVHDFSIYWSNDENYHWHKCLSDSCNEISDKTVHIWDDGVISMSPTCQEEGVKTYTCLICGRTKNEKIDVIEHNYITIPAKEATCEEDGVIEHKECGMCGKNEVEGNYIIEKHHEWSEVSYIWSADNTTCTARRNCLSDENHFEEETANTTSEIIQSKSCNENEITRYTAVFENTAFLKDTKDVTTQNAGHEYIFVETVNPTCATKGVIAHYQCAHCEKKFNLNYEEIVDIYTNEIGHDFNEPIYEWGENNNECIAKRVCKKDASHIEIEKSSSVISEVVKQPTCDDFGTIKYTAIFENEELESQETTVKIEKLGHDWITTYVWNEDHSKCTATRVCSRDEDHKISYEDNSETVDATSVLKASATCTTNEIRTYTAKFSKEYFEEQIEDVELENTARHTFVNHICSVCGEPDDDAIVKIISGGAEIGYTSLEEAIENANNQDELILLKDITISSPISITKKIFINFNECTIEANSGAFVVNGEGAQLLLREGELTTNNSWLIQVYEGYFYISSDMTLRSEYTSDDGYVIGYTEQAEIDLPDYPEEIHIIASITNTKEI